MEERLSVLDILIILKKRFKFILLSIVIGALMALAYVSFFAKGPEYPAKVDFYIQTHQKENSDFKPIENITTAINTYKSLIKSDAVINKTAEEINADINANQIRSKLEIIEDYGSQIFSLKVTDNDPDTAVEIANTLANNFVTTANEFRNLDTENGDSNEVHIMSEAVPEEKQKGKNYKPVLIVGVILGASFGVCLSFFIECVDDTVYSAQSVHNKFGWMTLGNID